MYAPSAVRCRRRPLALWGWLLACVALPLVAAEPVPRHPLEVRALTDPAAVRRELPGSIAAAYGRGDTHELALLYLAQANACRVMADWVCQRAAGARAHDAARAVDAPLLVVRGLIAESRGRIALQDYLHGEQLLGQAELLLRAHPHAELLGDVYLAYSSLSSFVAKPKAAAEFATKGLAALESDSDPALRVRLLRNRARSEAQLGQPAAAQRTLVQALTLIEPIDAPKLLAEVHLETARAARLSGDGPAQRASAARVLAIAARLANSQLEGQAREALGLAALDAGDRPLGVAELDRAYKSFHALELERDELRVLRTLLTLRLEDGAPPAVLNPLVAAFAALEARIEESDRAKAAADFDARLRYATQEAALARARSDVALAAAQAGALAASVRLNRAITLAVGAVLVVLLALFALARRANRRLEAAFAREHASETRYRMLAENSRDIVVRLRADGGNAYVSPSVAEVLGWSPAELSESRWDLVHPEDRAHAAQTIERLLQDGGGATLTYRVRHKDGHYVWLEIKGRRVERDGEHEVLYSARDVSVRMRAEQALKASQRQLRALADNIPAMISHLDASERYLFANAFTGRVFDVDPASLIGRTVRDVRGPAVYAEIEAHIRSVLRGERVSFEGRNRVGERDYAYQANYVPDIGPDGRVVGFFSLVLDITALKNAEQKLEQLARHDSLTGLANRRRFDEQLATAIARCHRHGQALTLIYLDLDRFKAVNDECGHGAGDDVLVEFARRLSAAVRTSDLVARFGGDEFVVLIEDATSAAVAEAVAHKLEALMQAPIATRAGAITLAVSVGIAFCTRPARGEDVLALADRALYAAKAAGRGTHRVLTDATDAAYAPKP